MFGLLLKTFEYLAPLSTLTYLSSKLTDAKLGSTTQWLIRKFISTYNINVSECLNEDLKSYQTFNEFFIRQLKPEARPIASSDVARAVSPVDGTVGQAGPIQSGRLIQAKGIDYSLNGLLGGNNQNVAPFANGIFACIYLSPANYHRIHMPLDGRLLRTVHIPGRHFPVGRRNVSYMDDLFTKNERLVCIFDTAYGPLALVMVGAALVGSIGTVWEGTIVRRSQVEEKDFSEQNLTFKRGDEIGHFKFGSTVITVWPQEIGALAPSIVPDAVMRMGKPLIANPQLAHN